MDIQCARCKKYIPSTALRCRHCGEERIPSPLSEVLLTSLPSVPGYEVIELHGVVCGEIVCPNGILGAFTTGTFFTIDALDTAKRKAMDQLKEKAANIGANAVLGVDIDINDLNGKGISVSINGTAAYLIPEMDSERIARIEFAKDERARKTQEIADQKAAAMNVTIDELTTDDLTALERSILQCIIKEAGISAMGIAKQMPRNISPDDIKNALEKFTAMDIVTLTEFGGYSAKAK